MSPVAVAVAVVFGVALAASVWCMGDALVGALRRAAAKVDESRVDPDVEQAAEEAMALCTEPLAALDARWARDGHDQELSGLIEEETNR